MAFLFWARRKVELKQLEDGWQDQQFHERRFTKYAFVEEEEEEEEEEDEEEQEHVGC